ncbi:hypothetical protein J6590_018288 [Homalodisca vitripennis]|nr:hypothetical protein J6590_018288 [Homalodisca vitripennis]
MRHLQPLKACRASFKELEIMTVVNLYIQEVITYKSTTQHQHPQLSYQTCFILRYTLAADCIIISQNN